MTSPTFNIDEEQLKQEHGLNNYTSFFLSISNQAVPARFSEVLGNLPPLEPLQNSQAFVTRSMNTEFRIWALEGDGSKQWRHLLNMLRLHNLATDSSNRCICFEKVQKTWLILDTPLPMLELPDDSPRFFLLIQLEYTGSPVTENRPRFNALQVLSLLSQVCISLEVARSAYLSFKENSLTPYHIHVKSTLKEYVKFRLRGKKLKVKTHGVHLIISSLYDLNVTKLVSRTIYRTLRHKLLPLRSRGSQDFQSLTAVAFHLLSASQPPVSSKRQVDDSFWTDPEWIEDLNFSSNLLECHLHKILPLRKRLKEGLQ